MMNPSLDPAQQGTVTKVDDSTLTVTGDLVFATALPLRQQGEALIPAMATSIAIDLAGVERVGSVGLSVLLCWLRQARQLNKALSFVNPPAALIDVSRVSGLDFILNESP